MVYPANAFDSRLRGDQVPLGSGSTKSQKERLFGLAACNRLFIFLPLSFSSSSYLLSFSKQNFKKLNIILFLKGKFAP